MLFYWALAGVWVAKRKPFSAAGVEANSTGKAFAV